MRHHRLLINRDDEITDWLVTSRFTWTSNVTKHVREKKKENFQKSSLFSSESPTLDKSTDYVNLVLHCTVYVVKFGTSEKTKFSPCQLLSLVCRSHRFGAKIAGVADLVVHSESNQICQQKYELTCCCRYGSKKIIIFSSHYSVTQFAQTDTHVLFEVMRYQVVLRHFNILINICQILLS